MHLAGWQWAVGGIEFGPGEAVIRKIRERMEEARSGDAITLKILRAGKVLELIVRVIAPEVFDYINNDNTLRQALNRHLWFSVPSTFVLPAMLYTGLKGYVRVHLSLAACFAVLWSGTFITGIFFLPPTPW